MFQAANAVIALAEHRGAARTVPAPLRRFRHGVELHSVREDGQGIISTVLKVPAILQGCYYVPGAPDAAPGDELWVQVHVPMRAFVLWPALQEPPPWLVDTWVHMRGDEVKVRWNGFTLQQRAWLNITSQRIMYQEQPLLVFTLASNQGIIPAGGQMELPSGVYPAEAKASGQPCLSHILCLCPVKSSTPSTAGDGSSMSALCTDVELAKLPTCSLEQIYTYLEDGALDPSGLSQEDANSLLQRAMLARDDELLLMLLERGMGTCCSHPCLQLLMQYAQLEDLPWLAQLVVTRTMVELTQPVLAWLVHALVVSNNMFEAEHLLSGYCLARRNPLSSIASVEHALLKVSTAGGIGKAEAVELGMRFRRAKNALLQQLVQQYTVIQQATAKASRTAAYQGQGTQGIPEHQQQLQEALLPGKAENTYSSSLQLDPLLHAVKLCMQEYTKPTLGRGATHMEPSIHDISPYTLALELGDDFEFFSFAPVVGYTRLVWRGYELNRMIRVARMAAAVAATTAAPAGGGSGSSINSWKLTGGGTTMAYLRTDDKGPAVNPETFFAATGEANDSSISNDPQEPPEPEQPGRVANPAPAWPPLSGGAAPEAAAPAVQNNSTGLGHKSGPGPCAEGVTGSSRSSTIQSFGAGSLSTPSSNAAASRNDRASFMSSISKSTRRATKPITFGSGASSAGTAAEAIASAACWTNPHVLLDLLQNMGLAGSSAAGSEGLARMGATLVHGVLLAPRAMHDSSRGRWMKRLLFEVLFLVVYQATVMGSPFTIAMATLPLLLLGNLVDIGFQVHYKFDSFWAYLQDHWNKLDVMVNCGLLAVLAWECVYMLKGWTSEDHHPEDVNGLLKRGVKLDDVVASAFAVLVWSRALGLFNPLSSRLGAMLYTLRRAAEEAAVMTPVLLVLMLGFGTTLTVVYANIMPAYRTLPAALRTLMGITGGDLRMMEMETQADGNPFLVVWGQGLVLLYIVVVNILIMTLLIAIINHTYHPESVKAQAVVMQAESVQHYSWHVRYALACSPANLLQLLLAWLPQGFRTRVLPADCLRWWIPPLDGYVPAFIAGAPLMLLGTGPSEVGYLAFLFLMYPLFSVTALVLLVLHVPFGVAHFAAKGHKVWLESSWYGDSVKAPEGGGPSVRPAAAAAGASLAGSAVVPANSSTTGGGWSSAGVAPVVRRGKKAPSASQLLFVDQSQGQFVPTYMRRRSVDMSVQSGAPNRSGSAANHGRNPLLHVHQVLQQAPMPRIIQYVYYAAKEWLACGIHYTLAAIVGLLAHLVLLVLLVLVLLWAWLTRVPFSLYCIFTPRAANANCCLKLTRLAHFWSKTNVLQAFTEAKIFCAGASHEQGVHNAHEVHFDDASCAVMLNLPPKVGTGSVSAVTCATVPDTKERLAAHTPQEGLEPAAATAAATAARAGTGCGAAILRAGAASNWGYSASGSSWSGSSPGTSLAGGGPFTAASLVLDGSLGYGSTRTSSTGRLHVLPGGLITWEEEQLILGGAPGKHGEGSSSAGMLPAQPGETQAAAASGLPLPRTKATLL